MKWIIFTKMFGGKSLSKRPRPPERGNKSSIIGFRRLRMKYGNENMKYGNRIIKHGNLKLTGK